MAARDSRLAFAVASESLSITVTRGSTPVEARNACADAAAAAGVFQLTIATSTVGRWRGGCIAATITVSLAVWPAASAPRAARCRAGPADRLDDAPGRRGAPATQPPAGSPCGAVRRSWPAQIAASAVSARSGAGRAATSPRSGAACSRGSSRSGRTCRRCRRRGWPSRRGPRPRPAARRQRAPAARSRSARSRSS